MSRIEKQYKSKLYESLGAYDYQKLQRDRILTVFDCKYHSTNGYRERHLNPGWNVVKKCIEQKLDVVIRFQRSCNDSGYYFDLGNRLDPIRIEFDNFDNCIILKDICMKYGYSLVEYFAQYFIVRFIGDNNLLQIIPFGILDLKFA